uniref:Predicted protein n=1 Tax=Hordeum vulgare subsp. vulgare TaxID=112509 RepID=F2DHK4_HORVV|nr:predicted protein [Hordeum vulgare subsp. vulgare]
MEKGRESYWKYYNLDEELFSVPNTDLKEKSIISDPYDSELAPFEVAQIPNPPPPPFNQKHFNNDLLRSLGKAQWLSLVDSLSNSAKQELYSKLSTLQPQEDSFVVFSPEYSWNERFQTLCESMSELSNNETSIKHEKDMLDIYSQLRDLAQAFISTATYYGKIIIVERHLSDKTIKPLTKQIGGIAGGDKYIVKGILFKFALDVNGIFGSDENAMKMAGHELINTIEVFNCYIKLLHIPLVCLIDYLGFRLVAMTLLPIDSSTIVYGSSDAGHTIHNSNLDMENCMKEISSKFNLKPHICGLGKDSKHLYTAADIEGHKGKDGRLYCIDLARLFPTEVPDRSVRASHLFRLLRPSFVKSYTKPLNPDCFTGFSPLNKVQDKREIEEATALLRSQIIPKFGMWLDSQDHSSIGANPRDYPNKFRISEKAHQWGINMRQLGILYDKTTSIEWKNIILIEMIARFIKNKIRYKFRTVLQKNQLYSEEPYRHIIIQDFNAYLSTSSTSQKAHYCQESFCALLREKYPGFPRKIITDEDIQFDRRILFKRLVQITGVKFTARAMQEFSTSIQSYKRTSPLDIIDLLEIREKIKKMDIVSQADGRVLYIKAIRTISESESLRYLELSVNQYQIALESMPDNSKILYDLALCYYNMAIRVNDMKLAKLHMENAIFNLKTAHRIEPNTTLYKDTLTSYESIFDKIISKSQYKCTILYEANSRKQINALAYINRDQLKLVVIGTADPRIYMSIISSNGDISQIVINGHGDSVTCINNVTSDIFASGSRDKCIRIWNITSINDEINVSCKNILKGHKDFIRCILFIVNTCYLLSSGDDRTVRLWNWESGKCLATIGFADKVISLDVKSDKIYCGMSNGILRILDLENIKSIIKEEHNDTIIERSCHDIELYNNENKEDIVTNDKVILIIEKSISQATPLFNSNQIAACSNIYTNSLPILYDTVQDILTNIPDKVTLYTKVLNLLNDVSQEIKDLPDSDLTKPWKVRATLNKILQCLQGSSENWHNSKPCSVTCDPESSLIFSGIKVDSCIVITDMSMKKVHKKLIGHRGWIRCLHYESSSNTLTSVSDDCTLRIWDISSAQCLRQIAAHSDEIYALSGDFKNIIITGSRDGLVKMWENTLNK